MTGGFKMTINGMNASESLYIKKKREIESNLREVTRNLTPQRMSDKKVSDPKRDRWPRYAVDILNELIDYCMRTGDDGSKVRGEIAKDPYLMFEILSDDLKYEFYSFMAVDRYAGVRGTDVNDPRRIDMIKRFAVEGGCFSQGGSYMEFGLGPECRSDNFKALRNAYAKPRFRLWNDSDITREQEAIIRKELVELIWGEVHGSWCINVTRNGANDTVIRLLGSVTVWECEDRIAETIADKVTRGPLYPAPRGELEELIDEYVRKNSSHFGSTGGFTQEQREAVILALSNQVSVITGGPGRGKTMVCDCIVWCFYILSNYEKKAILTSHTGKAMTNLRDSIGKKNSGVYRDKAELEDHAATLLSFWFRSGFRSEVIEKFQDNLVIIDEMSMVGMSLAAKTMKMFGNSQIVFVGDVYQLPSIDAGNVFTDVIYSKTVATAELREPMRSGSDGIIDKAAKHVLHGGVADFPREGTGGGETVDWGFLSTDDRQTAVKVAEDFVRRVDEVGNLAQADADQSYAIDRKRRGVMQSVFLLSPYSKRNSRNGDPTFLSTQRMNELIQEKTNPERYIRNDKIDRVYDDCDYRKNDRVMVTANDRELGIYNGTLGFVTGVSGDDVIFCPDAGRDGDMGNPVVIPRASRKILSLAYAMTIHKSQGSEAPVVMMVIPWKNKTAPIMNRNLIYTALTRSSRDIMIYGSDRAYDMAIRCERPPRKTRLLSLLTGDEPTVAELRSGC